MTMTLRRRWCLHLGKNKSCTFLWTIKQLQHFHSLRRSKLNLTVWRNDHTVLIHTNRCRFWQWNMILVAHSDRRKYHLRRVFRPNDHIHRMIKVVSDATLDLICGDSRSHQYQQEPDRTSKRWRGRVGDVAKSKDWYIGAKHHQRIKPRILAFHCFFCRISDHFTVARVIWVYYARTLRL